MLRQWCIFILFLLVGNAAYTQPVADSVDVDSRYYQCFTEEGYFGSYNIHYKALDTLVNDFHIYNEAIANYRINSTLGNIGQAWYNPLSYTKTVMGFVPNNFTQAIWEQGNDKVLYSRSRAPFLEAMYVNGSRREQRFFVNYNQNITKGLNFGFKFERINPVGFYQRQQTDYTNYLVYSSYLSSNKRYRYVFNFSRNNGRILLNGGIANTTDFTENIEPNRGIMDVNLLNASSLLKSRKVYFKQSYDLVRKDSSTTGNKDFFRLIHTLDFQLKNVIFKDSTASLDSVFVPLFDTTRTRDTMRTLSITNSFAIQWYTEGKDNRVIRNILAGVGHQYGFVNQFGLGIPQNLNTNFNTNNIFVEGAITQAIFKGWDINASGKLFVVGYNIGDYFAEAYLSKEGRVDTLQTYRITAGIESFAQEPIYTQQRYIGNYITFTNDFNKTFTNRAVATFTYPKIRLTAKAWVGNTVNLIYYNSIGVPQQNSGVVGMFGGDVVKKFTYGKKFHTDAYLTLQATTGNFMPVPNVILRLSNYFQGYIIKRAVLVSTGFDLFFNTTYDAPVFIVPTGQFGVQNQPLVRVGNYPYVDLFLNAQIKKARVFLKLENVLQGLIGNFHQQFVNYPMPDRAIKLGLNWRFYN